MPDEGELLYEAYFALISIGWILLLTILLILLHRINRNKPPKRPH